MKGQPKIKPTDRNNNINNNNNDKTAIIGLLSPSSTSTHGPCPLCFAFPVFQVMAPDSKALESMNLGVDASGIMLERKPWLLGCQLQPLALHH